MEEAVDGRQALDKFQAGRYDLILMGLQMPLMDGYEANRQIRATGAIRGWGGTSSPTPAPG